MTDVLYYGSSTQVHSGASQWMYRMADRMRSYGYEVTAVLPSDDGIAKWYDESGIETVEFWSEPIRRRRSYLGQLQYILIGLITIFRLAIYIRRNNVDIVHVNDVRFLSGLVAGKLGGATCICHVRANYDSETVRLVVSGFARLFSDQILCVSQRTREIMFDEVGLSTENVGVLYDCVPNPERFEDLEGSSFLEELGVDSENTVVLHVSKMTENKAQDRVLAVAEQVIDTVDDVSFVLVGGVVEGHEEYASDIRRRANELSNVHVAGFIRDVTDAFTASDISIHVPRHDDPFPGVVLEGMLAENPIIGSRSGGIPEQIEDGETGYLVPKTGGVAEIVEHITYLCENQDERQSMGVTAARRCREKFPPSLHFQLLDDTYTEVLKH